MITRINFLCWNSIALMMCSLVQIGCSSSSSKDLGTRDVSDFEIAADSNKVSRTRVVAAMKLKQEDRDKLRSLLTAQLPGNLDATTLDAIIVLGAVGDHTTIPILEHLQTLHIHGKLHANIDHSLELIRSRMDK